jgi:hypothetical protein
MDSYTAIDTALGFLTLLVIIWPGWNMARYLYLCWTRPNEKHRFPVLSTLIFLGCCLFFGLILFYLFFQSN